MNSYFYLALLASFMGPICYRFIPANTKIARFVDGMIITALVCLITFHILPESLAHSGITTILAVILGLVGPVFISQITKRKQCEIQKPFIIISALGFIAHNLIDGAALIIHPSAQKSTHLLALAIIIHRLIVSMGLYKTMSNSVGTYLSALALIGLNIAMACGFFFGNYIFTRMEADIFHILQSLTCGMLFHVLLHPHHLKELIKQAKNPSFLIKTQSVGAFCGIILACLAYLFWPAHSHLSHSSPEHRENHEQAISQ